MNKSALKALGVKPFDTASFLRSDEDARAFLAACIEEANGDDAFVAKALGTVARARGEMAAIAIHTGLSRESLYKSLSGERSPTFGTILKVASALGFPLTFGKRPADQTIAVTDRNLTTHDLTSTVLEHSTKSASVTVASEFVSVGSEKSLSTVTVTQVTGPSARSAIVYHQPLVPEKRARKARSEAMGRVRSVRAVGASVSVDLCPSSYALAAA